MLTPEEFKLIARSTHAQFEKYLMMASTIGEIIFLCMGVIKTRFEYGCRASLWSNIAICKYHPAPAFGKIGLLGKLFDQFWRHIRFSVQKYTRHERMSSE